MVAHLRLLGLLLFLPFLELAAQHPENNTYETPNRLFYIHRSANRNLVCYDYNLEQGKLDSQNPIQVYWVNREERPGEKNGLNYIQRKFAYGYKVISAKPDSCVCTLTAYPKRPLTLTHLPSSAKYVCLIPIQHQTAILRSLYVKAHPHNPLKVEYVELEGVALSSHKPLKERIYRP